MTKNYKDTLNLPDTAFPMKANLAAREPEILKHWNNINLYQLTQEKGRGKPKFILPDGPPYANGPIHLGHAVNKTLKDMVIKSRILSGFNAPFIPIWDCHGLPIELNVEKKVGKPGIDLDPKTFREKCRAYALTQIDIQRAAFIRLGLLGDFEHPALTMDYQYEADIIRSLAKIAVNGHLHQGYKPVHWCIDCGSALAEAEVEYKDKLSPSLDVCFLVMDPAKLSFAKKIKSDSPICVVIWTTTPWTLPANQAVAVHPEFTYALVALQGQNKYCIVALELVDVVMKRIGTENFEVLAECKGAALEGLQLQHPFYNRTVPIVLGEHVTLDTGTGCVHTAPAHGQEDFILGEKYHLPLDNPVDSRGCYLPQTPLFGGEFVFKANDSVIKTLKEHNHLLHEGKIEHSYPHCWRHKTPLIFRATPQWFIGMDQKGLRKALLEAIRTVEWIPSWGQARIEGMVADRPDWCISRQRTWGVPMGIFVHRETGDLHPKTPQLMEQVAKRVERQGIEAWYELSEEELLGEDAKQYTKSLDTLDVWFDSGVVHYCVLEMRKELAFPADLYLEGSDQHRGWFLSSLTTSVAMSGAAPYKQVLTHGFTVDAEGHKMSKSLGNTVAPEKVVNVLGADVLRLWVAATDYRAEMGVSEEILKRISDTYRRIRNTARFLLANLNGFDKDTHLIPPTELLALDHWIVERALNLQEEISKAFLEYQFHLAYQKIHNFCSIDLGSFYLDVIKDRQYTGKREGLPRRSAQTALYHIAESLVRWIAPILSFTAEEIWQHLPKDREPSVFLSEWYSFPPLAPNGDMQDKRNKRDNAFWQQVLAIRDAVNKTLEEARTEGIIGSGLEAEVDLYCTPALYQLLALLEDELRFVLITSRANIHLESERKDAKETELKGLWVTVQASKQLKCERCWHRRVDVNTDPEYPGICGRCVENISGLGEKRLYA